MSDTPVLPPLSPAEARRIDQTCDRFEAAWKSGQRPHPDDYAVLRVTDTSAAAAKEADAEADRAIAWLRQAVAAGYENVALMKKDTDLDALRDRADFQQLCASLAAKSP